MLPSDGVGTQSLRLSDHLAGDRAAPDLQHRAAGSGGLDANYEFLIRDERLIGSLAFTLIYTFGRVALEVVLGLMLAPDDCNSIERPDVVTPRSVRLHDKAGRYQVPQHSLLMMYAPITRLTGSGSLAAIERTAGLIALPFRRCSSAAWAL